MKTTEIQYMSIALVVDFRKTFNKAVLVEMTSIARPLAGLTWLARGGR